MGIGLSGMISGLDTESIVKAMVSGQRTKATKIENKITINKWTKEAWSGLNTKIYSFYTKYASKLRLQTSYMTRSAKSSNESVVTATANSNAALGTHSIKVKQLASSQYVTGGKLGAANKYNKNTKLVEVMGVTKGTIITIAGENGENVEKLDVTDKTTINDFLTACQDAGLTATFDTTQQRFFISSKESGAEDKFTITTKVLDPTTTQQFDDIASLVDTSVLTAADKTAYEAAMSTLRSNTEILSTVLADDYDSTKATTEEKAVLDAITVVKDAAESTLANQTAIDVEHDIITDILTNQTETAEGTIAYGSTKLTHAELKTSAEKAIEEKIKKAATDAAAKKIAAATITKEDGKSYANLSLITPEKYTAAQTTISECKDVDGNAITVAEADIDAQLAAGVISEKTAAGLRTAYATVNAWEAKTTVTAEDGSTTEMTIGELYEATYTAEEAAQNAALGDYDEAVLAEMEAQLIANQKDNYTQYVASKAQVLVAASDAEPTAEELDKVGLTEDIVDTYLENLTNTSGTGVLDKISTALDNIEAIESGATSVSPAVSELTKLGLGEITGSADSASSESDMAVIAATNAEFELDGAVMTETSNNFTVNGITLNLSATTESVENPGTYDTVQITVGKDTESTYKLVKEALTEYNKLIEEMNKLYDADSARGYDPLTDEQKEAMSEKEIEDWEEKIKSSLLRRDETLGSLLTSMRTSLATTYKGEDGTVYALSTFGIVTGNYTENGKLHIYGDEDDALYATYQDKLKAALEDDPDKVMETLTNVFGKLYETMTEKCGKTELRSALTFYNDKQYDNLVKDYEDDLDLMEERIKALEDRYYKQFTAMETALSKLQTQSSSLASLMGTSAQ